MKNLQYKSVGACPRGTTKPATPSEHPFTARTPWFDATRPTLRQTRRPRRGPRPRRTRAATWPHSGHGRFRTRRTTRPYPRRPAYRDRERREGGCPVVRRSRSDRAPDLATPQLGGPRRARDTRRFRTPIDTSDPRTEHLGVRLENQMSLVTSDFKT